MKILFLFIMFKTLFAIIPTKYLFNHHKHIFITPSSMQTQTWRQQQQWYINGKHNECELYQKKIIEQITNLPLEKTNKRIHTRTNKIYDMKQPMKSVDGFEYTENFDGYLFNNYNEYYFNLKVICNNGGAQTRTLRNVYHFISYQLEHLLKSHEYNPTPTYFINILDGDLSNKHMKKFYFLLDKPEYNSVQENVFIGDMKQFQDFWYVQHE